MHIFYRSIAVLGVFCGLPVLAAPPVAAETAAASAASAPSAVQGDVSRAVYQQRGADGRAVFTDRPAPGLVTERRWLIEPEDAQAAALRRDASRAQSDRVAERIQHSMDRQERLNADLQIEHLRAQRAADALRAERLRERDENAYWGPYLVLPGRRFGNERVDRSADTLGRAPALTYGQRALARPPLGKPVVSPPPIRSRPAPLAEPALR